MNDKDEREGGTDGNTEATKHKINRNTNSKQKLKLKETQGFNTSTQRNENQLNRL